MPSFSHGHCILSSSPHAMQQTHRQQSLSLLDHNQLELFLALHSHLEPAAHIQGHVNSLPQLEMRQPREPSSQRESKMEKHWFTRHSSEPAPHHLAFQPPWKPIGLATYGSSCGPSSWRAVVFWEFSTYFFEEGSKYESAHSWRQWRHPWAEEESR